MLWLRLRQLKSARWETRARAILKLGNSKHTRAVEPLIAALGDGNSLIRCNAAWALGSIGDTRAFEPLVTTLRDGDGLVRKEAARALGRLGRASGVDPLVVSLRDSDPNVREAVAEALELLGWQPTDDTQRVLRAIARKEWDEVAKAGATAVEPLLEAFAPRSELDDYHCRDFRQAAAHTLGQIGDPRAVEPLIRELQKWGRLSGLNFGEVATALGNIGSDAVGPLAAALKDPDKIVRWSAAIALAIVLGRTGDTKALEALICALSDKDIAGVAFRALILLLKAALAKGATVQIAPEHLNVLACQKDAVVIVSKESADTYEDCCRAGFVVRVQETSWGEIQMTLDCSLLRKFGHMELKRRGLPTN